MPPDLDIYGLTKHRDASTLGRFLDEYVDRVSGEDREGEELSLMPLDGKGGEDWEPALTLTHIVERGFDYPRRAFTTYHPSNQADLTRVILSFTEDDAVVLGVSMDDEGSAPENETRAKSLLAHLLEAYDCSMGLILVEHYPPSSEAQFLEAWAWPLAVYFTSR